jgi:glycosyltransferase involved in cell wall biosynthesis
MNVLSYNRDPQKWIGGDVIQQEATARALVELGVEVTLGYGQMDVSRFDLCHFHHLNFDWNLKPMSDCLDKGVPYVISAIYYPKQYTMTNSQMNYYGSRAKAVIALSEEEKQEIEENVGLTNVVVIPNGIDSHIFYPPEVREPENYILTVGRMFDEFKGYDRLAKIKSRLPFKWRHIGQPVNKYVVGSIDEYIPYQTPEQLRTHYQKARVFVSTSLTERQSLVVMEAVSCGCPTVDTIFNRGRDICKSTLKVDPNDPEVLYQAIMVASEMPMVTEVMPTWENVAKTIKQIYEK